MLNTQKIREDTCEHLWHVANYGGTIRKLCDEVDQLQAESNPLLGGDSEAVVVFDNGVVCTRGAVKEMRKDNKLLKEENQSWRKHVEANREVIDELRKKQDQLTRSLKGEKAENSYLCHRNASLAKEKSKLKEENEQLKKNLKEREQPTGTYKVYPSAYVPYASISCPNCNWVILERL
jgi:predicted RNase H-like nuclease (RuvC/YqgF family)